MIELVVASSVLVLIIAALRVCLRGRISARMQYALWGLVALRLLLPFSLFESPVSVMNLLPETPMVIRSEMGPAENPASNEAEAAQPVDELLTPVPTANPDGFDFRNFAEIVWLGGAALCGTVFFVSNLRMSRKLRNNRVQVELTDCKVAAYTVEGLPSPCLYGLWKPSIYLTSESMADDRQLIHILAHEETHYRHKDHLWALLRAVCVCLHWYNPLVWLAAALSRQDGELACDESTLQRLGDENRIAYGRTLIEMMTAPVRPADLFCCATTMRGGKGELAERLRRIARKPKVLATVVIAVLLVTVTAVAVTFGGAPKQAESPANIGLAEQLWNARTEYVGDASAVGMLVKLLPVPQGLQYDHFELQTNEPPYSVSITLKTDEQTRNFYAEAEHQAPLKRNALTLLALIDNVDSVIFVLDDGLNPYWEDFVRDWADNIVGGDVRGFGESPEQVAKLLELPLTTDSAAGDNGQSKPLAPVIQEEVTAVAITHRVGGTETVYTATGSSLNELRAWAAALQYEHKMFASKESPGDREGNESYDFVLKDGEYPGFSYVISGENECYLLMQGEWYLVLNPSDPPYDQSAEMPIATYRFTRFGKDGEVISIAALTDEKLAKSIIMDVMVKSSAWQGVDVSTLEEYYLIEQTFSATDETVEFYAYLLADGKAVLQSGSNGRYSYLSQELYEALDDIYSHAMQRTTDVLHDLTANGAVTISAGELPAYSWYTSNEKIRVALTGTDTPVVIELYDADNKNDMLMHFTLDAGKRSETFTNLTSARNYYITATGDRNADLTLSDASK